MRAGHAYDLDSKNWSGDPFSRMGSEARLETVFLRQKNESRGVLVRHQHYSTKVAYTINRLV